MLENRVGFVFEKRTLYEIHLYKRTPEKSNSNLEIRTPVREELS